jgi:hypothetical protein
VHARGVKAEERVCIAFEMYPRQAGGSSVRAVLEEAFFTQKKRGSSTKTIIALSSGSSEGRHKVSEQQSDGPTLAVAWAPLPQRSNSYDDDAVSRRLSRDLEVPGHRRLERSYEHKREKALAQTDGNENGFTLHHQEFDMFPVKCLILEPRTVYITAIRNPSNRFISLFNYDGRFLH